MQQTIIVFDLDDTLYKEIDFVISAFREIDKYLADKYNIKNSFEVMHNAQMSGINPFDALPQSLSITEFLDIYRNHSPLITLDPDTYTLLQHLKDSGYTLGIITDGRSTSQRNKIKALGLNNFMSNENIIISEEFGSQKPDKRNFEYFSNKYPHATRFIYIGDNPKKDFLAPNLLGWTSICLKDNGQNIHPQSLTLPTEYHPSTTIKSLSSISKFI